jgi:hypothetical protein
MRRSLNAMGWSLLGGVLAGTLDILYAIGFWSAYDVPASRILQSVAAGLLGPDAFKGGAKTAALGLLLHYSIAACMGLAYGWAARDARPLRDRPWRFGTMYGLALYVFMNFVVVPLSASPRGASLPLAWMAWSVLAHVVLVGWPCAWFARRGWDGRWSHARHALMPAAS